MFIVFCMIKSKPLPIWMKINFTFSLFYLPRFDYEKNTFPGVWRIAPNSLLNKRRTMWTEQVSSFPESVYQSKQNSRSAQLY